MSNKNKASALSKKQPQKPVVQKNSVTTVEHQVTSFSGPLPSPELIERYPQEVQDAILRMAEDGHRHHIQMESRVIGLDETALKGGLKSERLGMWFAFSLTSFLLLLTGVLLVSGKGQGAIAAAYIALTPVILAISYGVIARFRKNRRPLPETTANTPSAPSEDEEQAE